MKHIQEIDELIRLLWRSERFHCLIIESPPGWGKSSVVSKLLSDLEVPFEILGSYTTPLGLYNAFQKAPQKVHLMDDCAGIFQDQAAVSILKAATWESSGTGNKRFVKWNTSSGLVQKEGFSFTGKVILLTNYLPSGAEIRSLLSRSLHLSFGFKMEEIRRMLMEASQNELYFPDREAARVAANYLCANLHRFNEREVNLRTLHIAYELVRSSPERWVELLGRLVPRNQTGIIVNKLRYSGKSVKEQIEEFTRSTGKSRRTFFYYRKSAPDRA